MTTVYKYALNLTDAQIVMMPAGAIILHVGLDPARALCLWAEVNPDAAQQQRAIRIAGTGHPLAARQRRKHLGSVTLEEVGLVLHVFEVLEESTRL